MRICHLQPVEGRDIKVTWFNGPRGGNDVELGEIEVVAFDPASAKPPSVDYALDHAFGMLREQRPNIERDEVLFTVKLVGRWVRSIQMSQKLA